MKLADKFTRAGAVEGDIWYATTASGSKSLESVEDNIDNKLMTEIYADNTGSSNNGTTSEAIIVSYEIPANSVRTGILIMAGIRFVNSDSGGVSQSGTFRLKIAGSIVKILSLTGWDHGVGGANNLFGTAFFYWDTSATYTEAVTVLISSQNSDTQNTAYVDSFIILGI